MDLKRRYDSLHSYSATTQATEVNPGMVYWSEYRQGWGFNILIDGICVSSSHLFPREPIAKEAMRLEVDQIRIMLAKTAAVVEAETNAKPTQ